MTIFASCAISAYTLSAGAGTVVCYGVGGSSDMQCSSEPGAMYEDTTGATVTCPCSDLVPGLVGSVTYECHDATWTEAYRTCKCATCDAVQTGEVVSDIYGGTRSRLTITKRCASGCTCNSSCSGSSYQYVCKCSAGYTVVNQGSATCSCEENLTGGTCYVRYCNDGYYSTGTACVKCPNPTGQTIVSGGVKTGAYNTGDIYSCYINKGTTANDSTGSFSYVSNCNY